VTGYSGTPLAKKLGIKEGSKVLLSGAPRGFEIPTDITEDALREDLLGAGWVDNKVCAVSETLSGLRFVLRKENR